MLAPFMDKKNIIKIFGKNIFDDKTQIDGYEKLVGIRDCKPFECVGEIEECILAFLMLKNSEFKDDFIVKNINSKLKNYNINELKNKYLQEIM
ncbi:MAG: hypothetical protein LBC92_00290 [Rickettsiales bacterium]|jgi:hypothetical protein|nr:hypothetical protein [Rickettsiales bacterium]